MSTKYVKDPPEWFITRDYTYTTDLDAEGWLIAFFDRIAFDPISESRAFFVSGETDVWEAHRNSYSSKEACFDAYLARTHAPPERFRDKGHFPAVRDVSTAIDAEKVLSKKHVALVAVELDASEGTTIQQFTDWLTEQKSDHSIPSFPRRGPPKPENRVLTQDLLDQWASHRILQLWDLLFWRKFFEEEVSNDNLTNWLFKEELAHSDGDPKDKIRQSMDALEKAAALIIPLHFEMGN